MAGHAPSRQARADGSLRPSSPCRKRWPRRPGPCSWMPSAPSRRRRQAAGGPGGESHSRLLSRPPTPCLHAVEDVLSLAPVGVCASPGWCGWRPRRVSRLGGRLERRTSGRSSSGGPHPAALGASLAARDPAPEPAPGSVRADRSPLVDVVINPGLGFGTGLHPTTRGTLLLLQEGTRAAAGCARSGSRGPGPRWSDSGTGSGILAIAAAEAGLGAGVRLRQRPGGADVGAGEHRRQRGAERSSRCTRRM